VILPPLVFPGLGFEYSHISAVGQIFGERKMMVGHLRGKETIKTNFKKKLGASHRWTRMFGGFGQGNLIKVEGKLQLSSSY
jgi:hypothetical protein